MKSHPQVETGGCHRSLAPRGYVFSVLAAPVAQTCRLSVSPEIVAAREDFFNHGWTRINTDEDRLSLIRVHPCSSVVGTYWLRLRRAAQYRRFLTCHLPPASNVLPITNRRYGRFTICATVNRYPRGSRGPFNEPQSEERGRPCPYGDGSRTGFARTRLSALLACYFYGAKPKYFRNPRKSCRIVVKKLNAPFGPACGKGPRVRDG